MRYLLLGGSGFIGKHLTKSLLQEGHEVDVVDNCSTSTPIHNVNLYLEDIQTFDGIEELIRKADVVYFLAGSVGVKHVVENPYATLHNNLSLPMRIVPLVAKYNKKIIFSSTSEVYGNGPFSESNDAVIGAPTNLRWGYASAKLATEFLVASCGAPYRILRFFNITGPGQLGDFGMVLPRFVQAAKDNTPIYVYGDGTQYRSFCHINDALDMMRQVESSPEGVYNIGNDEPVTILELAEIVKEQLRSSSEIVFKPITDVYAKNSGDIHARIPDLTKLRNTIDYKVEHGLEAIIQDIYDQL